MNTVGFQRRAPCFVALDVGPVLLVRPYLVMTPGVWAQFPAGSTDQLANGFIVNQALASFGCCVGKCLFLLIPHNVVGECIGRSGRLLPTTACNFNHIIIVERFIHSALPVCKHLRSPVIDAVNGL